VLVPTKDRPEYLEKLLQSLVNQIEQAGRIIIVATGTDISDLIGRYSDKLPIEYVFSQQSGQIRQRNIGIKMLDKRTSLVACLDDDVELDKSAIREMIKFWNNSPVNTGGVGFHIKDGHVNPVSLLQKILFMGHSKPGRVLRSGFQSPISGLQESISSQWLNGGATVWRQDILIDNPHKEIDTNWAIAEDLIFSYPIGKVYPLFVCVNANLSLNDIPYGTTDSQWHFRYGKTQTLWVYHFVSSNRDLSRMLYLFTLFIRISGKYILGKARNRNDLEYFARGAMCGVGIIVKHALGLTSKDDIREN